MKIESFFANGTIKSFDTSNLVASDPFRSLQGAVSAATEFVLDLSSPDQIQREGLFVKVFFHDLRIPWGQPIIDKTLDREAQQIQVAARKVQAAMLVLSPTEVENVTIVMVDENPVLWHQEGELIIGTKLHAQEILNYSDETTKSINTRAAKLYENLQESYKTAIFLCKAEIEKLELINNSPTNKELNNLRAKLTKLEEQNTHEAISQTLGYTPTSMRKVLSMHLEQENQGGEANIKENSLN